MKSLPFILGLLVGTALWAQTTQPLAFAPTVQPVLNVTGGGSALSNLTTTLTKGQNGVVVSGPNGVVTIRNVAFTGGEYDILIQSGGKVDADGLLFVNPSQYGIYLGKGAGTTKRNTGTFKNVTMKLLTAGEHDIRIYFSTNLVFENWNLTHHAPYTGATLNVREITGDVINGVNKTYWKDIDLEGRSAGFGPNTAEPKEDSYVAENVTVDGGTWNLDTQITFWPNSRNITLKNLTINIAHGEGFAVKGKMTTSAGLLRRAAAHGITIDHCTVTASKLFTGEADGIRFINGTTFNGNAP